MSAVEVPSVCFLRFTTKNYIQIHEMHHANCSAFALTQWMLSSYFTKRMVEASQFLSKPSTCRDGRHVSTSSLLYRSEAKIACIAWSQSLHSSVVTRPNQSRAEHGRSLSSRETQSCQSWCLSPFFIASNN